MFANRTQFRTGDPGEVMNKTSSLSLRSNAVPVWNTVRISQIVGRLRVSGEAVPDTEPAPISTLCHAQIIPTATNSLDPEMQGVDLAHNTLVCLDIAVYC